LGSAVLLDMVIPNHADAPAPWVGVFCFPPDQARLGGVSKRRVW
jgi:hypothetical protein